MAPLILAYPCPRYLFKRNCSHAFNRCEPEKPAFDLTDLLRGRDRLTFQ